MIRGSCICGAVRFEIDEVRALTHCHCSNCRKLSGAAFASYAHVDADKFRFLSGEDTTVTYESTPGAFRHRCKVCGRTTPGRAPYLTTISIPAGLLDDDPRGSTEFTGIIPVHPETAQIFEKLIREVASIFPSTDIVLAAISFRREHGG